MSLEDLKQALPVYAKDLKLNLSSMLGAPAASSLSIQQLWGTALAVAVTSRGTATLRAIETEARHHLSDEAYTAAKAAAAIMAMNNVYYRSVHLLDEGTGHHSYSSLPARLRMQVIGAPGVDKIDFELWCVAVSAVNGCGGCLQSHEKVLRDKGVPREAIHEAIRVASVVHAVSVITETEDALAPV